MNIRDWLTYRFLPCTQKDRDAARSFLAAGRRQAISGLSPLCARHPALRLLADGPRHLKEACDYHYTVAFAVIGLLGANMYFPEHKRRPTTEAIKSELESWRRESYGNDAHHLLSKLNITAASAEAIVAAWLLEQTARKAGDSAAAEKIRALKNDEKLLAALGADIVAHAGEAVVACFLEDKNKC
ncbi:MAG: hypothetical protein RIN56_08395 [Sporomusaceae bacterium]|nr:hypothetical protein [Sporomusaceae bacterium]